MFFCYLIQTNKKLTTYEKEQLARTVLDTSLLGYLRRYDDNNNVSAITKPRQSVAQMVCCFLRFLGYSMPRVE